MLGCESESPQSNYDYNEQIHPVYYKHDLSAQNANYQREINVYMDMLFHEEKYEVEIEEVEIIKEHITFKIPKKFIIKDTLPKNASGKVLKNELRNMFK